MTDDERWQFLQLVAERKAKQDLLDALLVSTGLGEYIAKAIADHELSNHSGD